MENKVKVLIGVLAVLFVCLVTWVVRTTPDKPPPSDYVEPPSYMEYENNTLTEEKDGVKIWEITSDKIRVDSNTHRAEFSNIKGKFFQEDGKVLELTAIQGYYDQDTHNVHVEGDVVMTDGDGGKLETVNLDWLSNEEMLIATEDVRIAKDDMRAFADRAESMNGFQKFLLKGNARVLKGVKDDTTENPKPNEGNNNPQ
ncbi:MAG: LPS export ABC transporter periplasmic protein LptC [Selenomonadaceae bacterium]|nr:LPS export ABC transporter periplasmic protein LptC [Selenomonadaceae bacterium]